MKNAKFNVLNVSALLAAAMVTGSVTAGPEPGAVNQGRWVESNVYTAQSLPSNESVKAGESYHWSDEQEVFVCRVKLNNIGNLPGKFISTKTVGDKCYAAYRGYEMSSDLFEVLEQPYLYSDRYYWVDYEDHIKTGQHANKAVKGGSESGVNIYICRTKYGNDTVVGKYIPLHYGCYFEYNGSEHMYRADNESTQFDVLIQSSYLEGGGGTAPGGGGHQLPGGDGDGNMY
ncbi:MAG: DUF3421 domain-containing protein [Algicola sp.]|nr:DUF3421 domain-containing protein [Algicola sp.]